MKYLAKLKQTPLLLAMALLLIAPAAIQAYAQEDPQKPPEIPVANLDENGELEDELPEVVETPEPTPEDTEEPPTVPEEQEVIEPPVEEIDDPEDNEDPVEPEDTPEAAFDRYMAFAQAEHPGVAVAEVKFVWKQGVKSAKVVFEDGWKVYIGVTDGSTLKVADHNGRVKKCQKRMLSNRGWSRWYKTHKSYYQWWLSQQNQDNDQTDQEQEGEVQGAATENGSRKNKKSKKHHSSRRNSHSRSNSWSNNWRR